MIKAIIFDLGGVVFTNGTKRFAKFLAETYNLEYDQVLKMIEHGPVGNDYREAKISREEFWGQVLTELGITGDIDQLEAKWFEGYELIVDTRHIVLELKKKYKLYFLSDNVETRAKFLEEKFAFTQWFEDGIFSHVIGMRKPNPEVYKQALQLADVQANEALFIDDKERMITPAKDLGIDAILFENPNQLRAELLVRGLLT